MNEANKKSLADRIRKDLTQHHGCVPSIKLRDYFLWGDDMLRCPVSAGGVFSVTGEGRAFPDRPVTVIYGPQARATHRRMSRLIKAGINYL